MRDRAKGSDFESGRRARPQVGRISRGRSVDDRARHTRSLGIGTGRSQFSVHGHCSRSRRRADASSKPIQCRSSRQNSIPDQGLTQVRAGERLGVRTLRVWAVNHWVVLTGECESSIPENAASGRNPDGCTRCPDRRFPKQRISPSPWTRANAIEKLEFCADLNRFLLAGKPLTAGLGEFRCLEFASPSAISEHRHLVNATHENRRCVLGSSSEKNRSCFLPVRVLSRLFRRLFLEDLEKAYADGDSRARGILCHGLLY
jgi:hypothetical protein